MHVLFFSAFNVFYTQSHDASGNSDTIPVLNSLHLIVTHSEFTATERQPGTGSVGRIVLGILSTKKSRPHICIMSSMPLSYASISLMAPFYQGR